MSWEVVEMMPGHVVRFFEGGGSREAEQAELMLQPGVPEALANSNSWVLLDPDGQVQGIGGTIEQWQGRHTAWLLIHEITGSKARALLRALRKGLASVSGRVEATVRADFAEGHRFIRALGFEVENAPGVLKRYGPAGEDHIAYVRFCE